MSKIIIDGILFAAYSANNYEKSIYERGYTAVPKDDVDSVTKQDLINHPEKFRPYIYTRSSDFILSYEDFATYGLRYLHYSDGRSILVSDIDSHTSFKDKYKLIQDLVYMKKNYPGLYDEMLKKSNIPDIISEAEERYKKENPVTSNKPTNSGGVSTDPGGKGKTHRPSMPITITPEHVNADELPERITYVKKKVGDGFMFVVEDEQASKTATKSESKNKPTETYTRSVITESNTMKDSVDKIQQNSSCVGTTSVITGKGQSYTINNQPNFKAEDINLNDTLARIDAENDNAGIIMRPDGTKYIVTNNQVQQPLLPTPQMAVPVQTAPQTQVSAAPTPIEAFDPAADPQLISVIGKLQGEGTFRVNLNTECGVTKVIVEDANGKLINNLCFTVDLVGVCQTPDRKMWFGLPEIPDFAPSYAFNDAAINMIFTGEGEENLSPVFNAETCKLNRLVNLHSIFNIPGLDAATILSMMKVIKGIINKRSVKIELEKRDNMNVRFTIGNFKDPKNFRLILQNRTYLYNGGPLSNNKNKSFYIEVQNNQMKLYTGKKSKQQHTTITPEQEETNKRITAILNEQISTKPSDIVNPNNQEEPNVVIEDLDPIPETVTA